MDDAVKLVSMGDQITASAGAFKNCVTGDNHTAEMDPAKIPHTIIVIAGNVDNVNAFPRQPQHLLHDIIVRLRPEPSALHLPAIDNIADKIKRFTLHSADEVEQQISLTTARSEVNIRQKNRPIMTGRGHGLYGCLGGHAPGAFLLGIYAIRSQGERVA